MILSGSVNTVWKPARSKERSSIGTVRRKHRYLDRPMLKRCVKRTRPWKLVEVCRRARSGMHVNCDCWCRGELDYRHCMVMDRSKYMQTTLVPMKYAKMLLASQSSYRSCAVCTSIT